MQVLTEPAKEYAHEIVGKMSRSELQIALENIGVAVYDDEDIGDLMDSYVDSVEAKDIEFSFDMHTAKAAGHHAYMMWLDIDDIWE